MASSRSNVGVLVEVFATGGTIMSHHRHYLQAVRPGAGVLNEREIHKMQVPQRDEIFVGTKNVDLEKSARVVATGRQFFCEVEARVEIPENIAGWVLHDSYCWQLVTKEHPKAKRAYPIGQHPGCCLRTVSGDFNSGKCLRPVGDKSPVNCNVHQSHEVRRDAREAEWAENSRRRREEADRDTQARQYTRDLWDMACDLMDVEPERRGVVRGGADQITVDTEILQSMLRRLIDTV